MTTAELRRQRLSVAKAEARQPNPQAFPSGGPSSMAFCAYDPDRYDVCGDPDCNCRSSRNNTRGFGATEQEAIQDFWEQWEEA